MFAEISKLALTVMLLMLSVTEPVLVAVTFLTALVVLRTWLPKFSEMGESATAGACRGLSSKTTPQPPVPLQFDPDMSPPLKAVP